MISVGVGSRVLASDTLGKVRVMDGARPTRAAEIILRSGHQIVVAPTMMLQVAGEDGIKFRRASAIEAGDFVAIGPASHVGREDRIRDWAGKERVVSPDLAFLLGVLTAKGSRSGETVKVRISGDRLRDHVSEMFATRLVRVSTYRAYRPGEHPELVLTSAAVRRWLADIGCTARSPQRSIPDFILTAPMPVILAYLRGLFLHCRVKLLSGRPIGVIFRSASHDLSADVLALLTMLGVLADHLELPAGDSRVNAFGVHAQRLLRLVPLVDDDQLEVSAELLTTAINPALRVHDVVPFADGKLLHSLLPHDAYRIGATGRRKRARDAFSFLHTQRRRGITRGTVEALSQVQGMHLPAPLQEVLDRKLHFVPVTATNQLRTQMHQLPGQQAWVDGVEVRR